MTHPENANEQLREQCSDIQARLGVDDIKWCLMFGNNAGLYGLIQSERAKAVQEFAEQLLKARDKASEPYRSKHGMVYPRYAGDWLKDYIDTSLARNGQEDSHGLD